MNYMVVDKNIAKKYAKAFMLVYPQPLSDRDIQAMRHAQEFLKNHKKVVFFLQLPQFNKEKKKDMVADLLHYFSLPENLGALIHLLIKHNRSFYLSDVLYNIIELYREKTNCIEFVSSSTRVLNESQKNTLRKFLKHLLHKEIILSDAIDPSLIAGLQLKSHNYLWEYSVRKHIQALQALQR